nr:MAG TPA: Integrase [Caudoviricetes sp.]
MPERIRKTARYHGKKYEATGKTELEALKKLAAMLDAAEKGEISSNSTVDAWYQQWMELYKKPKGLTAKSLGMYDEKYKKYIKPAIGHMKLKDVRDVHLQKILNSQAGMSESHVKKVRMVLQELFKRARQSRLIVYDPAELLTLPNMAAHKRRPITEEERKAILAVAETHRSGLWILTLLYTGMRPGETAALTWGDVDFDRNEIHVHAARESGMTNAIKAPKTASGVRDIPIHAALLPKLQAARRRPSDYVFPTGSGNPQNENSLRRLWTGFKRDLDIYMGAETKRNKIITSVVSDDLTPYCLRHTFCTDLQRAGVPINVAKELMGHADIQTTANIYTHKDGKILHQNMGLLDGTGGKSGGK